MPPDEPRRRRERSHRYPGVPLDEAIEAARSIDERGASGLPAGALASALGYTNIRTQSFSARLSAARQFGLVELKSRGYALSDLARAILHPVDPGALPGLYRRALLSPPLYAELALRFSGRKVPEPSVLANLLYHHHHITASAKDAAAEAFVASARFAGALGPDGVFRPDGPPPPPEPGPAGPTPDAMPRVVEPPRPRRPEKVGGGRSAVRLDLPLWGADRGKVLRLRAPESISRESFERFLQAFRLHVRIEDQPDPS